jgi:hypothetical protein
MSRRVDCRCWETSPCEDAQTRFWAKVDKSGDCWTWTALIHTAGYGSFRPHNQGPVLYAHRYAYELEVAQIPEGMVLDHLCRNRRCVNPAHLEPVTHRENILRGTGASARNVDKTHCPKGHPYTDDNTYRAKGHGRECRACIRGRYDPVARAARHRASRVAA